MQKNKRKTAWILIAVLLGVLAGTIGLYSMITKGIGDSDFFWHITLGKEIVTSGKIPKEDIFSWLSLEKGYVETAHSWLGSVIIYLFSTITENPAAGGMIFNWLFYSLLAFMLIIWYGFPMSKEHSENDFLNTVIALSAGLSISMMGSTIRPLVLGLILFVAAMKIMQETYRDPGYKHAMLLPVISLLWANLHGGSIPILFAFNGLFLVMSLIPKFDIEGITETTGYSIRRVKKFAILTVSDILAALINPYGYKLFIYFFVTNDAVTKKFITEWQPSRFNDLLLLSPLILLFLVMLWRKRKVNMYALMPVLCTLFLCAKYCRIQCYLVLCTTMFISDTLRYTVPEDWTAKKVNKTDVEKLWKLFPICVILISLAVTLEVPGFLSDPEKQNDLSQDMLTALAAKNPQRQYNGYNAGGYLIYHGYKSFIDSRADPFDSKELEDAILFEKLMVKNGDDAQEYLDRYNFDAILVKAGAPLRTYLDIHPDWELYFEDNTYALYTPAV